MYIKLYPQKHSSDKTLDRLIQEKKRITRIKDNYKYYADDIKRAPNIKKQISMNIK